MSATTTDGFLGNRLQLQQPADGFRTGHDGVLLAACVDVGEGESATNICELGSGAGVVSLCVAARLPAAQLVGIEQDAAAVAMANNNAAANNLSERCRFINADITHKFTALQLPANSFAEVIANPPYYEAGKVPPQPNAQKANATIAAPETLAAWIKCAASLVAAGGYFTMVHHPAALPQLLRELAPRFGGVQIIPVHSQAERPATRLLVRGKRDSRAALQLRPPLVLQGEGGEPTREAEAILRGGKSLAFGGQAV